jgi:transposase
MEPSNACLLRMGRLPDAWVAPPAVRELRELVRYRARLVALCSGLKASVHAVLAKQGVHIAVSDLFGVGGRDLLAAAPLDGAFRGRVDSLCRLIDSVDFEINAIAKQVKARLARHHGFTAIQAIPVSARCSLDRYRPTDALSAAGDHKRRSSGHGAVTSCRRFSHGPHAAPHAAVRHGHDDR